MNQELKLGLLELNDIYYCLSTVSRDKDTHRSKEMAELADRVLDHMFVKVQEVEDMVAGMKLTNELQGMLDEVNK
jgi:hypothetical protein